MMSYLSFDTPLLQVCLEYLERYYFLIAFTAYLAGPSFDPGSPAAHATFAEWWRHRPELRSILERMLRRNPLAALSLDKSPDALAAGGDAIEKGQWGERPAASARLHVDVECTVVKPCKGLWFCGVGWCSCMKL